MVLALAIVKTTAATEFSSGSCAATVKTQFLFLEKVPPCFHCFNDLSRIYPVLSFTKDTDRVFSLSTKPMLLPFRSYTSTVSGYIIYFVSFQPLLKVVYRGLHIPVLPISLVRAISGLSCGSLLRVDITNPRSMSASPIDSNAS